MKRLTVLLLAGLAVAAAPPSGKKPARAPRKPAAPRRVVFRDTLATLAAIRAHLRKQEVADRPYFRYFTLTHLHNNPKVSAAELRLHRAALAKMVNSLSWQAKVVVPEAVDPEGTVLAVDLRKLGWDRTHLWKGMLAYYPYGLDYSHARDAKVQDEAIQIYKFTRTKLPFVRADWFVASTAQPPLYHHLLYDTLLGLKNSRKYPMTAWHLEKKLGVDTADNIRKGKVARAGFTNSGVARHNRLVERHESPYGAYWRSYDFRSSVGRANLYRYPLGPAFKGNLYNGKAFKQAGGEVLFNLPNGLQGYLLVDHSDRRIDVAPLECAVKDTRKTVGTQEVVNGISCMACHKHGIVSGFKDAVRRGHALRGDPARKVEQLYPAHKGMANLLKEDTERFLEALKRATGPFLLAGADKGKKLEDFEEPVVRVFKGHVLEGVTLEAAALELGLKDPRTLRQLILVSKRLKKLGLLPLTRGGSIKRETWESPDYSRTAFQLAALELELGSPSRGR
jgi:serine/threonine-protein kinase